MNMDRRKFIKTAGLAAGATLLSGIGLAEVTTEKTKSMKIVVLTGSPRLNGNTNHMASQFIKGAEEAGHDVYRFDCTRHKVAGCIGCNACGMNGDCFMQDDFSELRPHLLEADMVVFVYFGFSSQLKAVIDRFYAINGRIKGAAKQAAFIMAYADRGGTDGVPLQDPAELSGLERQGHGHRSRNVACRSRAEYEVQPSGIRIGQEFIERCSTVLILNNDVWNRNTRDNLHRTDSPAVFRRQENTRTDERSGQRGAQFQGRRERRGKRP